MDELLSSLFSMPTLPWTSALVVALVYWLTVILGALDVDALGGAEGKASGVGEAGAEVGASHVGDAPAASPGHEPVAKAETLALLLSALGFRSVPVTISLSFVVLFGWIASYLLARHVAPMLPDPDALGHAIVGALSLLFGLLAASLAVRPLAPLFVPRQGTRHRDLVGKVVRITTGRVDGRFGEARYEDGGADLTLQVRCADPDALSRGDEALVLDWDPESETFEVEPMSRLARIDGPRAVAARALRDGAVDGSEPTTKEHIETRRR